MDFYGLLATFLCVELPVTTMTLCPPTFLYSSTHPPGGWPSNTGSLLLMLLLSLSSFLSVCPLNAPRFNILHDDDDDDDDDDDMCEMSQLRPLR